MNPKVWDIWYYDSTPIELPDKINCILVDELEFDRKVEEFPSWCRFFDRGMMEQGIDAMYVPKPGMERVLDSFKPYHGTLCTGVVIG